MNSIHSYLLHLKPGSFETLALKLETIEYLEYYPDERFETLILVFESPDKEAVKELEKKLESYPEVFLLSFVFGASEELEVA